MPWYINRPQDGYFANSLHHVHSVCLYPPVHDGDCLTPLRENQALMLTFCGHNLSLEPDQSFQSKWSPAIVRLLRRSCADAVVHHVTLGHLPTMASLNEACDAGGDRSLHLLEGARARMLGFDVADSYNDRQPLSVLRDHIDRHLLRDNAFLQASLLGPLAEALNVKIVVWVQDPQRPDHLCVWRDSQVRQTQGTSHPSRLMASYIPRHPALKWVYCTQFKPSRPYLFLRFVPTQTGMPFIYAPVGARKTINLRFSNPSRPGDPGVFRWGSTEGGHFDLVLMRHSPWRSVSGDPDRKKSTDNGGALAAREIPLDDRHALLRDAAVSAHTTINWRCVYLEVYVSALLFAPCHRRRCLSS